MSGAFPGPESAPAKTQATRPEAPPAAPAGTLPGSATPAGTGEKIVVANRTIVLRDRPSVDGDVCGRVKQGERLRAVGRTGDWWEIRLDSGAKAFIHINFAEVDKSLPASATDTGCPPDTKTPRLLSAAPMTFSHNHGTVFMNLTVNEKGIVTAVDVAGSTTGDPALDRQAISEARRMRFAPMIRDCVARRFIYRFERSF
jgi:TonB family protein